MSPLLRADLLAIIHAAWVMFVVFSLPLILIGHWRGWAWVGNRWFRGIHLAMISLVILRTFVWSACPLTWWEMDLRQLAGQVDAEGDVYFADPSVGWFFHRMIHPVGVPLWIFPPIYAAFGVLVFLTAWRVPIRWRGGRTIEPAQPLASSATSARRNGSASVTTPTV